jgi:hypothetical protein
MIAGPLRGRAERCLSRLLEQTLLGQMEIVVVDISPGGPSLAGADHPAVRYFPRSDLAYYSMAQAECVRQARAEIIAFVEDHCYAAAGWAAAVVEAFRQPGVAVVSYAFVNHNPERYLSRAFFVAEYGRWMAPASRGPVPIPTCNNVAYRRRDLEPFFAQLDELFEAEFVMQRRILAGGGVAWLEPAAEVAHESWYHLADGLRANAAMKRANAARRAMAGHWGVLRRCAFAGAMAIAPALHLWRLAASLPKRPSCWAAFLASLPVSLAVYVTSSWQEALGYLLGPGGSREDFKSTELSVDRTH